MAKNRKYQSAAIRFGPALKAFLLCLLIGGSGVGYVWQKSQIYELDRQIKAREIKLAEMRRQNEKMSGQLAKLRTPTQLEERIRELNLGLSAPRQSSVVRLLEPVPGARLPAEPGLAARSMPRRE